MFKIENLDEEFVRRGFLDLRGKFDLIVSHWTLRHLADPFGTLKRMYSLLNQRNGMLMSNALFFRCDDEHIDLESVLSSTNAVALFWYRGGHRSDSIDFLLMRQNAQELAIPLVYDLIIEKEGGGLNASGIIISFKKGCIEILEGEQKHILRGDVWSSAEFCRTGCQASIDLYESLVRAGLYIR